MRCPYCNMLDDDALRRGYCIHCKRDIHAPPVDFVPADRRPGQPAAAAPTTRNTPRRLGGSGGRLVCRVCPKCFATRHTKVLPRQLVAFAFDRRCDECGTVYSPPTPWWGRVLLCLVGLVLGAGGVACLFFVGHQFITYHSSLGWSDVPKIAAKIVPLLCASLVGIAIMFGTLRRGLFPVTLPDRVSEVAQTIADLAHGAASILSGERQDAAPGTIEGASKPTE